MVLIRQMLEGSGLKDLNKIATAIEETAAENGYRVLLSNSLQEEGRELRAIENFLARQIDAC